MSGRALVAYGDATQLATWSNIPYFFLQAGRQVGLFQGGVVLRPERFHRRRLMWNALRPLALDQPRGFMYSRGYLEALWGARQAPSEVNEYVSHYQLLPPRHLVREPITYYIDATMRQFFDEYQWQIGRRIRADALAREKEAYLAARFVVGMSSWCAEDLTATYGVPAEKVRVIAPGANIDTAHIPAAQLSDDVSSPLRLGLVGVDWQRKGGPLLLKVATTLQKMGHDVEVVVVGPDPSSLPTHVALRALGFIDKARDPSRFIDVVRSFHFGCLLSRSEALGIFPLECLRLGVPVIVSDVGGLENPQAAGLRIPSGQTPEYIAEEIAAVMRVPERYSQMRAATRALGRYYDWHRTAREFRALLEE